MTDDNPRTRPFHLIGEMARLIGDFLSHRILTKDHPEVTVELDPVKLDEAYRHLMNTLDAVSKKNSELTQENGEMRADLAAVRETVEYLREAAPWRIREGDSMEDAVKKINDNLTAMERRMEQLASDQKQAAETLKKIEENMVTKEGLELAITRLEGRVNNIKQRVTETIPLKIDNANKGTKLWIVIGALGFAGTLILQLIILFARTGL